MRLLDFLPLALLGSLAGALPLDAAQDDESAVADLTADARARAFQQVDEQASRLRARGLEPTCTKDKLYFRKE